MTGEDALFDGPGPSCIFLKEFFIVICFDEKRADSAQHFEDKSCRITEIGEHAKAGTIGRNAKSDGIGGVVRNGEGADREASQGKFRARLEQPPVSMNEPGVLESPGGQGIAKDRHRVAHEQDFQSARVIAVLVGKKDAGKLLGRGAGGLHARRQLPGTQSGVDEERSRFATNESGIAVASTRKGDYLEHGTCIAAPA